MSACVEPDPRKMLDLSCSSWGITRGSGLVDEDDKAVIERQARELGLLRERLLVADRLASMGHLAASAAHELNNPLATVIGNLDMLAEELVAALPEQREMLADAREAAERLRLTVRDLKLLSRSDDARGTAADLERVLDSCARLLWNELRHRARLVKEYGRVPLVAMSEPRLGQALVNLLIHAARALPEGRAAEHELRVRTTREGERAVVEVRDDGPGLTAEARARLFEPFADAQSGAGTGLGLPICRALLREDGGDITVESEPGRGTVFRIALPLAGEAPLVAPSSVAPSTALRGRVLVIDDEPMVGHSTQRILGREHDVQVLTGARSALSRIGEGERYDVILCDLMMPELTGMDLHSELARVAPDQAERLVFMTGGAFTPGAREFLERVPNPRVEKPFVIAQLRALVRERVAVARSA